MKRRAPPKTGPTETVRERIIAAGSRLLAEGGRDALTTRAVSAAATVQAPTIYRLFGDKDGLLQAVAEHELARFISRKRGHAPKGDALDDLRAGWDVTIAFGLEHPAVFSILSADAPSGRLTRVASDGLEVLQQRVKNVAAAGLLRVSEARAVDLIRAAGNGTVLALLEKPAAHRDLGLSVAAREAIIAAITTSRPVVRRGGVASAAIALRASLDDTAPLTAGERSLLLELLERLAG